MAYVKLSAETRARRECDLAAMRLRYQRLFGQYKANPRMHPKPLSLSDIERACLIGTKLTENPALKEALEIAAEYFKDAASPV
jgi:hypothetical protein